MCIVQVCILEVLRSVRSGMFSSEQSWDCSLSKFYEHRAPKRRFESVDTNIDLQYHTSNGE